VAVVMSRRSDAPKFTGPLKEPIVEIYSPSVGLLGEAFNETQREAVIDRAFRRQLEKLPLLFTHYGIDPNYEHRWEALSYFLARDFVPGMKAVFSPPSRPGRKKTWQAGLGDTLIEDVQALTRTKAKNVRAAIRLLHSDRTKGWWRYSIETLEARHRDAKARQRQQGRLLAEALMQYQPPIEEIAALGQSALAEKGAGPSAGLLGPLGAPESERQN
jgi:hypothetical protein